MVSLSSSLYLCISVFLYIYIFDVVDSTEVSIYVEVIGFHKRYGLCV